MDCCRRDLARPKRRSVVFVFLAHPQVYLSVFSDTDLLFVFFNCFAFIFLLIIILLHINSV